MAANRKVPRPGRHRGRHGCSLPTQIEILLDSPRDTRARNVALMREASDEAYVLDLCDDILSERARRQHRFPWLAGDTGKDGRRRLLPVDAYYPDHGLVIEYRERQHDEPVPHFDHRHTISGVARGEQRRLYDLRREQEIPARGLRLLVVRPRDLVCDRRQRLCRDAAADRALLEQLLTPYGDRKESL
jgi:hypothetical protein